MTKQNQNNKEKGRKLHVRIPYALNEGLEEYKSKYGFNSYSEVVRTLIRKGLNEEDML